MPAKRPGTLAITLVLAGAAIAYIVLMFLPTQRALRTLRAELREKQDKIIQADQLTATIAELEKHVQRAKDYDRRWTKSTISEKEMLKLFSELNQHASETKVAIQRLEPQSGESMATISTARLLVVCSASYEKLFEFVRRIDGLATPIWISDLQIDVPRESGKELQCQLTLTIFMNNRENSG